MDRDGLHSLLVARDIKIKHVVIFCFFSNLPLLQLPLIQIESSQRIESESETWAISIGLCRVPSARAHPAAALGVTMVVVACVKTRIVRNNSPQFR
jgi:hypothetical protein